MFSFDRWLWRLVGTSLLAFLSVLAWEAWRNGEQLQVTQRAASKEIHTTLESLSASAADLQDTTRRLNTTLDVINRPCDSKDAQDKLLSDGVLCRLNKTMKDVGNVAATTQKQVMQTDELIASTSSAIANTSRKIGEDADALRDTTRSLGAASEALKTTIEGTQPLVANVNGGVTDMRDLLKGQLMTDTSRMVKSWANISDDANKVSDKFTRDYLTPKPWYVKAGRFSGDAADVFGLVARHIP